MNIYNGAVAQQASYPPNPCRAVPSLRTIKGHDTNMSACFQRTPTLVDTAQTHTLDSDIINSIGHYSNIFIYTYIYILYAILFSQIVQGVVETKQRRNDTQSRSKSTRRCHYLTAADLPLQNITEPMAVETTHHVVKTRTIEQQKILHVEIHGIDRTLKTLSDRPEGNTTPTAILSNMRQPSRPQPLR